MKSIFKKVITLFLIAVVAVQTNVMLVGAEQKFNFGKINFQESLQINVVQNATDPKFLLARNGLTGEVYKYSFDDFVNKTVTTEAAYNFPQRNYVVEEDTTDFIIKLDGNVIGKFNKAKTQASSNGVAVTRNDINILGHAKGKVYAYTIDSSLNKYLIFNDGSKFGNNNLVDPTKTVTSKFAGDIGVLMIAGADRTKNVIINTDGDIVADASKNYLDSSINDFGFITIEYAKGGISHTKILNFKGGDILQSEIQGRNAKMSASNVRLEYSQKDYLKDGKYIFTVIDPHTGVTCHYLLTIYGTVKENIVNPKTSIDSNIIAISVIGLSLVAIIGINSKKLKKLTK